MSEPSVFPTEGHQGSTCLFQTSTTGTSGEGGGESFVVRPPDLMDRNPEQQESTVVFSDRVLSRVCPSHVHQGFVSRLDIMVHVDIN